MTSSCATPATVKARFRFSSAIASYSARVIGRRARNQSTALSKSTSSKPVGNTSAEYGDGHAPARAGRGHADDSDVLALACLERERDRHAIRPLHDEVPRSLAPHPEDGA